MQIVLNHHHDKPLIEILEVENFWDRRFLLTHPFGKSPLARWVQCTFSKRAAQHILAPQFYHDTTQRQDQTEPDQSAH
jgi:hypothetical protein